MSKIRLEDGTIEFGGNWYSSEALAKIIQDRIQAGDMKIADLSVALEQLNLALENTHIIEESLVLAKEDLAKLLQAGGGDEKDCVRQAVMAYIGKGGIDPKPATVATYNKEGPKTVIKCATCKKPIEVPSSERPIVLDCPGCGTSCRLTL